MKVVVYGVGAIGSMVASFLKRSKNSDENEIHLVGRKLFLEMVSSNGILFKPFKSNEKEWVKTGGISYTSTLQIYEMLM